MIAIKIDSVEQKQVEFGTKTTIISGGNKYSFFDTKKDGSNTKAYEQFKKYGFGIGDTVSAEVKEEEKNFTNKEGKNIDYIQRTILYFQEVENTPVVKSERDVWAEIDILKKRVTDLENLDSIPDEGVKSGNVFGE